MAFDLDDEELKATRKLLGIDKENNIKGYSIQNGEPTPDNPAEIKSLDIEEDIRILKDLIQDIEITFEGRIKNKLTNEEIKAISNVLAERKQDKARIKELEEENRMQRKQIMSAYNRGWIPKQKVKDLKESIILEPTIVGGRRNAKTLEYGIKLGKIKAYEELLEESK